MAVDSLTSEGIPLSVTMPELVGVGEIEEVAAAVRASCAAEAVAEAAAPAAEKKEQMEA